jgi:AGZA family xanthine/uracil permease-like MFS transporter
MFDFFKQVVTFHPIKHTLAVQKWNISGHGGQFGLAFITFLVYPPNKPHLRPTSNTEFVQYVDILDTTGTMYSMARFAGAIDEKTQDFEGSAIAYVSPHSSPARHHQLKTYPDGRRDFHLDRIPPR